MIDILIPVLGRPQNVRPLIESIRFSSAHEHKILFLCSESDWSFFSIDWEGGWEDYVECVDWEPAHADYAKKINYGFGITDREWVFQGADDLRFHPGWDVAALEAAGSRYGVVGTNDLHHRGTRKGLHSTHSLIRRSYIEKYGSGTWDNSGLVLSEVYDHQFVDNELVEVAQSRVQYVHAHDSRVEHLHPLWHRAESDATYEKAMRAKEEDARLYRERSQRFWNQRRRPSKSRSS